MKTTLCTILVVSASVLLPKLHEPSQAPKAIDKLESLAWMAGHWQQQGKEALTEELWMPARGKMMIGVNRGVRGGKQASFEFLRIEERAGAVSYLASPSGAPPTSFRLTEVDETHAVFENPKHDFPKRIEYRLKDGKLVASIAGDKPGPSWTFERTGDVK